MTLLHAVDELHNVKTLQSAKPTHIGAAISHRIILREAA